MRNSSASQYLQIVCTLNFSGFLVFIWCFLSFVGNIMNNLLFLVHLRAKFKYNSSLLSTRVSISNLINQRCSWWSLHWSVDFAIYIKMPFEAKVTDTVWCEVANNTVVPYTMEHLLNSSLLEIIWGRSPMCWSGGPQRRTAAPSHWGCSVSPAGLPKLQRRRPQLSDLWR